MLRPKPMVEIGGKPILWHIMQIHAVYGVTEFIIALGYKGEMIKEYFLNFFAINNDLSVDLSTGKRQSMMETSQSGPFIWPIQDRQRRRVDG